MNFIFQTWHWFISGFMIGLVMLTLTYFGKAFGMSSNFRSLCSMTGVGKHISFFDWDWKGQRWNLAVVFGAIIGGFIATHFMLIPSNVQLSADTLANLSTLHIDFPNGKLLPDSIFSVAVFESPRMMAILLFGGFLVGFGARYAGGCTSGHAISGLSNFQIPSLKAVIGFFIGGLIMAHFILPLLF